jgi:hypothetical protein
MVNALRRVKKIDQGSIFPASTRVDARRVSPEYVSHAFELGVDERQRMLTRVDERSLNDPFSLGIWYNTSFNALNITGSKTCSTDLL